MTNDREKQAKSEGSSISDETLRFYLLGLLPETERLALDEQLLVNDGFAEHVQLAESDLIDDYAAGKLDAGQRELFVSKFLVTSSRKRDLQLASGLRDYVQVVKPVEVQLKEPTWKEKLAGFFAFDSPRGWATAASFAVLILVIGLVWLATRQRQPNELIARREAVPPNLASPAPPTAVQPEPITAPQPSPEVKPAATPTPGDTAPPATVASFVLLPGAMRSSGDMTRVAIPGGERDIVRLSLVLETPAEGNYQAELATSEGQKVLMRPNLKPVRNGQTKVVVTVPARLLQTRDYQIKLSRKNPDGQSESVGRYYFRAQEQ